MRSALKRIILNVLHRAGYDLAPYPWDEWYDLRRHTLAIFNHHKVNCVIDVGACQGQYGKLLRSFGYRGRIVSFEPVPKQFEFTKQVTSGDPSWSVQNMALGSSKGILPFHVMVGGDFSSFLFPDPNASSFMSEKNTVAETIDVKVTRLDSMFDAIVAVICPPSLYQS